MIPHQVEGKESFPPDVGTAEGYWWLHMTSLTQWGGGEHMWCSKEWKVQGKQPQDSTRKRKKQECGGLKVPQGETAGAERLWPSHPALRGATRLTVGEGA